MYRCLLILFSLLVLSNSIFVEGHPIKVSTGELVYHHERDELVLKFRFFEDDFVYCINEKFKSSASIKEESTSSGELMQKFIKDYFWLKADGRKLIPAFKSIYREEQVVILEYTISCKSVRKIGSMEVYFPILIDYFKEQQNLFRVDLLNDGNMTTFRFNKDCHAEKKVFNQILKK